MLTVKASENVVRLFPPLVVSNKELDEAITKIEKVCQEMSWVINNFINISDIKKTDLRKIIDKSIKDYTKDVKSRRFPYSINVYK